MKIVKKKVYLFTKKVEMFSKLLFTKSLNRLEHCTWHHFPKMNYSRRCWKTQLLSTLGFGNEMMLKSKLPPFSLIHIQCQRAFCFQLYSLLPLSKFCYMLTDQAY